MTRSPLIAVRLKQHHKVLPTPTNDDRLRAYRMQAPTTRGNAYPWPHLKRKH